jgi:DNA-binding ferritin-like protein (Dps family)
MENRAKALPEDYYNTYKAMRKYLWNSDRVMGWQETIFVFNHIIELLEEAAAFCDALVIDAKSWVDKQRHKLGRCD